MRLLSTRQVAALLGHALLADTAYHEMHASFHATMRRASHSDALIIPMLFDFIDYGSTDEDKGVYNGIHFTLTLRRIYSCVNYFRYPYCGYMDREASRTTEAV